MEEEKSDFGRGFVYNLILFAAHFDRDMPKRDGTFDYFMWFNGASDHLLELEIPEKFRNTIIGAKAQELQDLALEIGHGCGKDDATRRYFNKCQRLTKEIGLLIDVELGLKPEKALWE